MTDGQALALARKSGKPVQVTGATTVDSTLAANPNGTFTVTQSNMPVRAYTGGKWRSLDATLHRNADGSVSPAVTSAGLRLSGGGTDPLVSMTSEGKTLSVSFPGTLPAPVLSGATATYPSVLPGVDLVVTADTQGGFDYVLVVKNAAAAANPALRSLAMRTTASGDLTLREDAKGNISAVNRGGRAYFTEPAPSMWDSRAATGTANAPLKTAVNSFTRQRIDLRNGNDVASGNSGPGEAARTAAVGVRYSHGTVTYTPNRSLLNGKSTAYPVYIDPWSPPAGGTLGYWADVTNIPSADIKPTLMQVGYEGWPSSGASGFIARAFVNMSVPSEIYGSGTDIQSATLYLTDSYAPSCSTSAGDYGVQVWQTNYVGSSSPPTWSSQNASGFWAKEQQEKSFAHGYDSSCPTASEGFDVSQAATSAAHSSWANVTFGIKADNESDKYGWKDFANTASMSITYDRPPTIGDLSTSPSTACNGSSTIGQGDLQLGATIGTPDGYNSGSLSTTFHLTNTTTGKAISTSAHTGGKNKDPIPQLYTEATMETSVAAGAADKFSWYATVTDGVLSATSGTCTFTYDRTVPGQPTVKQDTTDANNGWILQPDDVTYWGTISTPVLFTITPAKGTTVSAYSYQLDGAAPRHVDVTSSGSCTASACTVSVTPTAWTSALTVTALSAGGNVGDTASVPPFISATPNPEADGDMTGDGTPDLVTPGGGSTGLAPGLWLASQHSVPGQANGDGTLNTSMVNLGQWGVPFTGDNSPSDFAGTQVITGNFDPTTNRQDALVYYPSTYTGNSSYVGQGALLYGQGDGTPFQDQDANNTTGIFSTVFEDGSIPALPQQIANAFNASTVNPDYPGLLSIVGTGNNSYLDYYSSDGTIGGWNHAIELPDDTPDQAGAYDWYDWTMATMQEPASATNTDGIDVFLWKSGGSGSHPLYLWQNFQVTSISASNPTDSHNPQIELSANWQPVGSGNVVSELRAADITGSGPALWAVSTTGSATPWTASLTASNGVVTGGTITPATAQSLLSPTHAWRLGDDTTTGATIGTTSGTTTAKPAADTGNTTTPWAMTGTGGANWNNDNDLFKPSASFDGTGYLSESTGGFDINAGFTVSAWVKPNALGGAILSENASYNACMFSYIDTTTISGVTYGRWNVAIANANGSSRTYAVATAGDSYYVKPGTWTHLTMTFDASQSYLRLYVNGMPAGAVSVPAWAYVGCGNFSLGHYLDNGGASHGLFKGKIADVQIYANQVLTPAQVATIDGTRGFDLVQENPAANTLIPAATSTTGWQWVTACGKMLFYQGQIKIQQTCTGSSTVTIGASTPTAGATLTLQDDGNFIIRSSSGTALWNSGTHTYTDNALIFQPDGNLVIYGDYGQTLWASGTTNASYDS